MKHAERWSNVGILLNHTLKALLGYSKRSFSDFYNVNPNERKIVSNTFIKSHIHKRNLSSVHKSIGVYKLSYLGN